MRDVISVSPGESPAFISILSSLLVPTSIILSSAFPWCTTKTLCRLSSGITAKEGMIIPLRGRILTSSCANESARTDSQIFG